MYCLPVHLKKTLLRLASSLISDIPHDMTDALKARIRHHLLFGVNLKVAALWMSTPPHVDLFKCHRSLFCDCGTGQTKGEGGGGYGGRENTLAVFFFLPPPEETQMTYNQLGSAGGSFNTWRGMWVLSVGLWRARELIRSFDDVFNYSDGWMAALNYRAEVPSLGWLNSFPLLYFILKMSSRHFWDHPEHVVCVNILPDISAACH